MMEEKKQEERGVSRRMAAGTVLAAAAGLVIAKDAAAGQLATGSSVVPYAELIDGALESASWAEAHTRADPHYAILKKVMIPFGWNGKKMIDAVSGQVPMLQQGSRGFSYPGPEGRPVAYFVFDTQGENSIRMIERLKPLLHDIDIHFYPVAYLNWRSGPQGAQILGAAEPWRALDHHIVRFSDPETRGLRVSRTGDRPAMESAVWANGKVYREVGGRDVPFGVFKSGPNRYVPFNGSLTEEDFRTVLRKGDSPYYSPRK